jgi:hypothetical protein
MTKMLLFPNYVKEQLVCAYVARLLVSLVSKNEKGLDKPATGKIQPLNFNYIRIDLALADFEHFRAASRTYALSCGLTVFHGDAFGIFHFLLGTAFHTIGLHLLPPS